MDVNRKRKVKAKQGGGRYNPSRFVPSDYNGRVWYRRDDRDGGYAKPPLRARILLGTNASRVGPRNAVKSKDIRDIRDIRSRERMGEGKIGTK